MSEQLPPPPRRPAPHEPRDRIESELAQAQRRRRLNAAPVMILVAAVAVVIAAVLGVNAYRQPMTAEPATTVSPAPLNPTPAATSPSAPSPTAPSPAATASDISSGAPTLSLDVRALSDREVTSSRKACNAQLAKEDRPPSSAGVAYARYERWASLDGPGWNQSKVLIERQPGVGSWVCVGDGSESAPDDTDRPTAAVPAWEVENYGSSYGTCTSRLSGTLLAAELFQVGDSVALARVRLVHGGHKGPWQTATPIGGYVHVTIGLVAEDPWTTSLTAEFQFLDSDGTMLKAQPYGPRGTATTTKISSEISTCADMRYYRQDNDPYRPPTGTKAAVTACAKLAATADPGLSRKDWELPLGHSDGRAWGGVLRKGDKRFACSLAPTREVSKVVDDQASTAKSSFWFAVNPIAATEGSSFWAAGRVPHDVTAISYQLPGSVKVAATIDTDGYWMAMYHVDGKDLDTGNVSTWEPVTVTITRTSGAPISYVIPFSDATMCNQVSHGC